MAKFKVNDTVMIHCLASIAHGLKATVMEVTDDDLYWVRVHKDTSPGYSRFSASELLLIVPDESMVSLYNWLSE